MFEAVEIYQFRGLRSLLNTPKGKQVFFYEDEHYYLSNFSAFALVVGGETWMTVEHIYQAMKFSDHLRIRGLIKDALSAHVSREIARANKKLVRSDWNQVKLQIMESLIKTKISQHPYVLRRLLETGDAILIENSNENAFWGRGSDWCGQNHLGRIWMKLRGQERTLHVEGKGIPKEH